MSPLIWICTVLNSMSKCKSHLKLPVLILYNQSSTKKLKIERYGDIVNLGISVWFQFEKIEKFAFNLLN